MGLELRSIAIDGDNAEVTLYDGRRLVSVQMTLLELRDPARFVAVIEDQTGRRLDWHDCFPDPVTWRGYLSFRFNLNLSDPLSRPGGREDVSRK